MGRLTVMLRHRLLGTLLLVFIICPPRSAAAQHKYVGVAKCKVCHMDARLGGNNFGAWKASPHARAFETLATDKAKAKAKELKIADPQTSERCLKCHVTAHGAPAALVGLGVKNEDGVGCERCHGPGSDYLPNEVMRDKKVLAKMGLRPPDEKLCRECHNLEGPFYKDFDFKTYVAKIAHPKSGAPPAKAR